MDKSPLESAVHGRLKESMASIVGTQNFDEAAVERMAAEKTALVLPILRETLLEDATPSLDQIHRAELEATKRSMKTMIGLMTDPGTTVAELKAKAELAAVPAPVPVDLLADELEARLAELEARIDPVAARAPRLQPEEDETAGEAPAESGNAGEPPTPQG